MPYIVKSSLDIGGKIIPGNDVQVNKLIKEKEEFLKEEVETPMVVEEPIEEVEEPEKKTLKKDLKKRKKTR